jgi:hypothetical protein
MGSDFEIDVAAERRLTEFFGCYRAAQLMA